MKNKKDIFDLFRENEHKLDERPDGKLWDRLEGRLDSHEPRLGRRNGWRQWMSMVGVLAFLVVAISAINLVLKSDNNEAMHAEAKGVHKVAMVLEEIGVYSDKSDSYTATEYQKILARLNTSPILEGDVSKKIRVQKSVFASMSERSKNYIASVNTILEKEKTVAKTKEQNLSDEIFADTELGDSSISYDAVAMNSPASTIHKADKLEVAEEEMATELLDVAADVAATEADADEVAGHTYDAPATAAEDDTYVDGITILDSQSNAISVAANTEQISIQQFQWLLGQWEAPANDVLAQVQQESGNYNKDSARKTRSKAEKKSKRPATYTTYANRSVEEWKPMDAFTIEGKGYLVVNGDTTFTERMQIKNIGEDLYYILALDDSGKTVQYKLKTYTAEAAVFENQSVAFPNQVILQRDMQSKNFTTLLQNMAPAQINSEQQRYFQNRNMINNEQIKRVMNRVDKE